MAITVDGRCNLVLIGTAREGLSDVTFEKKRPELGGEGRKPWNAGRESTEGWAKSQCKGPEAGRCLNVHSIVRGRRGCRQMIEGERVAGEV